MKRPSFQFYPGDWRTDTNLRRCSHAARGAWMDVLCLLHDADEYGVLRWPLKEIAGASGVPMALLRELASKDVLKGADKQVPAYIHTPRHAGKAGEPVELLPACDGPCWYSARFLKDEWRRSRRGEGTRFDSENQPNKPPSRTPTRAVGESSGDGASASSSSSLGNEVSRDGLPAAPALEGVFEGHANPQAATPNPVAQYARALTSAGVQATSLNPELIEYHREGGTVEHLLEIAKLDRCKGKGATYIAKAARGELATRASTITASARAGPSGASKTLGAMQKLQGVGYGLAGGRTAERTDEVALLGVGSDPGE